MKSREEYLDVLKNQPYRVGHLVGYDKLGLLHNQWMKEMLYGKSDMTLLAHRLSYKTTCVSIVLAMLLLLRPRSSIMFMRKTDADVVEIIAQVKKILENDGFRHLAQRVMGAPITIIKSNSTEINTSFNDSPRGTSQLLGIGSAGSLTGKHYDYVFTDDIVNVKDRISKAERDRVKLVYQELQNIRNHGGRIINTATPWHKEDAISLMPNVQRFDCYQTGIMPPELIEEKRRSMAPSLFAANYELRHIAAENALFGTAPTFTAEKDILRNGVAHMDAAYGGEDYTALTLGRRVGGTLYLYGRLWQKHVDLVMGAALAECETFLCAPIYCETNGDKGYLSRELRRQGAVTRPYPEKQNKYLKISTFLRKWWGNIVFVEGTDPEYIAQIMDYTEDAQHDDAPDSAACICRILDRKE